MLGSARLCFWVGVVVAGDRNTVGVLDDLSDVGRLGVGHRSGSSGDDDSGGGAGFFGVEVVEGEAVHAAFDDPDAAGVLAGQDGGVLFLAASEVSFGGGVFGTVAAPEGAPDVSLAGEANEQDATVGVAEHSTLFSVFDSGLANPTLLGEVFVSPIAVFRG